MDVPLFITVGFLGERGLIVESRFGWYLHLHRDPRSTALSIRTLLPLSLCIAVSPSC